MPRTRALRCFSNTHIPGFADNPKTFLKDSGHRHAPNYRFDNEKGPGIRLG